MLWKKLKNYRQYQDFELLLAGFEKMAKTYAKNSYDIFFHLPVEFPFVEDGHRPTSERFRRVSEERLLACYYELEISPVIISGTIHERLAHILNHLNLEPLISLDQAIQYGIELKKQNFDRISLE